VESFVGRADHPPILDSLGDGTGNTLDFPTGIAGDGAEKVFVSGYMSETIFKIVA
jgi:hypothetical protein